MIEHAENVEFSKVKIGFFIGEDEEVVIHEKVKCSYHLDGNFFFLTKEDGTIIFYPLHAVLWLRSEPLD